MIHARLIAACFFKIIHVIAIVQFCHVRAGTVQHNQYQNKVKRMITARRLVNSFNNLAFFYFYFGFLTTAFFLLIAYSIRPDSFTRPQEKTGKRYTIHFPGFYHDFLFVTVIIDCCCFNNKFYVSAHIIFFSTEGMICIVIRADRIQTIQDILQIIIYKI